MDPKKDIRDLSQFDPGEGEFLRDLFVTVRKLSEDLYLEERGYRMIVNGEEYQDFPQLHFDFRRVILSAVRLEDAKDLIGIIIADVHRPVKF